MSRKGRRRKPKPIQPEPLTFPVIGLIDGQYHVVVNDPRFDTSESALMARVILGQLLGQLPRAITR